MTSGSTDTPSARVTNLYRDEILDGARLPVLHVAYTPCLPPLEYEAPAATPRHQRGHQFDKVEICVNFVEPEALGLRAREPGRCGLRRFVRRLGILHRVSRCARGPELHAARKFGVAIWAAVLQEWLDSARALVPRFPGAPC